MNPNNFHIHYGKHKEHTAVDIDIANIFMN